MRVNSAAALAVVLAATGGCVVGVTPVIQYGPLTVEFGPQGGQAAGPPTPTPLPSNPQLLAVVGAPGQETLSVVAFFPSDIWDYLIVSCAVTPVGSAPVPQKLDVKARTGATHAVVYESPKPVASGRYFAQLTYAKGRLKAHVPPAAPVWHEAPEQTTLSLSTEIAK